MSRSLAGVRATRIVIAHRLSTIQHADRLYVLQGRRVVESGAFAELMHESGAFAELARRQLTSPSRLPRPVGRAAARSA